MPNGLNLAEQMYYQAVRSLYNAYNNREISKDVATREKKQLYEKLQKDLEVLAMYEKVSLVYGECLKLHKKKKVTLSEYRDAFSLIEDNL